MAKIVSEKQINSFVKGLITEASPLTYPENASLDEENFDLEIDGSRTRRLGIDYEVAYALTNTGLSTAELSSAYIDTFTWTFPGGVSNVVLGIIRISDRLYFIDLLAANPSANLKNSGNYEVVLGMENSKVQFTNLNNYLLLVGEAFLHPIILSYNGTTDVVTSENAPLKIRDFFGVYDGLEPDERPITLSNAHKYNLRNQGWSTKIRTICDTSDVYIQNGPFYKEELLVSSASLVDAIACTYTHLHNYPSNADQWSLGKVGDSNSTNFEKYDPNSLLKNSMDQAQVSRGRYIIDAYFRGTSREAVSGISNLPFDWGGARVSTCATHAGRVFYAGGDSLVVSGDRNSPDCSGFIFFSQVGTSKEKLVLCYQENDPTSPEISDILDTDGGTIQINNAGKIVKLIEGPNSLVVFAENGIWEVFSEPSGFTATSYQVVKVSSVGINNPDAVVDTDSMIVYWAKTGIHTLSINPQTNRLTSQNISIPTIQTFYTNLPDITKQNARGFYDSVHNHVRWLYNDSDTYSETNYRNNYTKELNLDLTLQAFYIYSISSLATNSPYICGYIPIPGASRTTVDSAVYVGSSDVQVTSLDPVIVTLDTNTTTRQGTYNFLVMRGSSFTVATYNNRTFKDWVTANGVGVDFTSYLITGYELFGDILRTKQVPYIKFYFDRTEDGFESVGGNLELKHQSSCLVQAQWNWTDSANSGKWGAQFQAYKLLRPYVPSGVGDTFDYGERVIVTKNKLRGSGTCLSLKIQSEAGKDMKLLGWAMETTGNSKA